jgi:D-beta-D-heptose 7-phosphate kinase/D-beta-D-heptose 1-phosphate adenosyltransferase
MENLINILDGIGSPRVVLVGDLMLDEFVYGDAERISPEAPVPVLRAVRRESRLGGAGNVAMAIRALGGQVAVVGLVGNDSAGKRLIGLLDECDANLDAIIRHQDPDRPTIVKARYVGLAQHRHAQQMLRVDDEDTSPLPDAIRKQLFKAAADQLAGADILALEDYGKGLLDGESLPVLIAEARKRGVKVIVDPVPTDDFSRYRGATILTPNRYEAELASGVRIDSEASAEAAAEKILAITEAEAVVITLDKQGAYLKSAGAAGGSIPTRPRNVYDVTGAGDVVMATLSLAVAGGVGLDDAVALANVAGGLEVERFGVVPVTRDEISDELRSMIGLRRSKIMDREQLVAELERRRRNGATVVFTNGCFDLLHMGHVKYLQQAREKGNCLVVAINSDESVRRLKGSDRPICPQAERAKMLAALECIDYVTIFEEDTPEPLLELLRPEVLVKGGSTPEIVGQGLVEGYGGKVERLELVEGLSTTDIINRILENHDGK